MRRYSAYVYAAGHFLVDFFCALFLISRQPPAYAFILYNFCAFAMQFPIGLLADTLGYNRGFALAGVLLVFSSLLPTPLPLQVTLVGLGNACYHIGGGREALLSGNTFTGLGFFVSPGAVGIFLGTLWAEKTAAHITCAVLLLILIFFLVAFCDNKRMIRKPKSGQPWIAAAMLAVVVLRSVVGLSMLTPWKTGVFITVGALAGALGKFLGGAAADIFGADRAGVISLLLAAVLFCFPDSAAAGVLAVLLFNMTMPITLGKASQALPGFEGTAFGLLTFGLFLGYLPSVVGCSLSGVVSVLLTLLSAAILLLNRRNQNV